MFLLWLRKRPNQTFFSLEMTQISLPYIFDGHNDMLSRMMARCSEGYETAFKGGWDGQFDLPKASDGGMKAGFFAVFVSSGGGGGSILDQMQAPTYDLPLPAFVRQDKAQEVAWQQIHILKDLQSRGLLNICVDIPQIQNSVAEGKMAAVLHMEGAEAIGRSLSELEVFYEAGLRSLGPVWSRPTIFGEGVPFRFPSSPDTGAGLTELGRDLVRRCNDLKILVDVSHLTEAGFWDVASVTDAPIVATHSNAHALCPHSRNLTDKQLAAIAESNGVVGLNFATAMLRSDGRMVEDTGIEVMIRHLEHLIGILGEGGVALGSDFDGATVPAAIGSASGLGALRAAMKSAGFDDPLIEKLCHRNWLDVLARTWA